MVRIYLRCDAVAQIEHMTIAGTKLPQDLTHFLADTGGGCI